MHLFPTEDENDIYNQKECAIVIGSLRYATDCTRPDIGYVVGVLARFSSKPNFEHWNAMTQLMRYLKRTAHYGLLYQRYILPFLKDIVMLVGTPYQVILCLPLAMYLH